MKPLFAAVRRLVIERRDAKVDAYSYSHAGDDGTPAPLVRDPDDTDGAPRQQKRLLGALVLLAIAVIVLPSIFDGSGRNPETQYQRVEQLREEPPRLIDGDGRRTTLEISPENDQYEYTRELRSEGPSAPVMTTDLPDSSPAAAAIVDDADTIAEDPLADTEPDMVAELPAAGPVIEPVAWIVEVGGYQSVDAATAARDRVRDAGYPSFVQSPSEPATLFRVRVGPMIDPSRAEQLQPLVSELLGREAAVKGYP